MIEAHETNDNRFYNSFENSFQTLTNKNNLGKFLGNNFTTGFCFNKACSSKDLDYTLDAASQYIDLHF